MTTINRLLILCLFLVLPTASWARRFMADGILYRTTSDSTVEVTCTELLPDQAFPNGDDYSGVVSVPATVVCDDVCYQVTAIGDMAFANCEELSFVVIPQGVTRIGDYAFFGCINVKQVIMPDGLTSIGSFAFRECYYFSPIEIPATVTHIGSSAFSYCTLITSITLPPDISKIPSSLFAGCMMLEEIELPKRVRTIEPFAFQDCSSLRRVVLSDEVESIGRSAFADCSELEDINLPESLTEIGNYAFRDCFSLQSITLPNQVSEVGNYAFSGCFSLTDVQLSESLTSIGDYAFSYCESMLDVTLPASLTRMGEGAFCDCYEITRMDLPKGITRIEPYTFSGCASLTEVSIPLTVTEIGDEAFYDCEGLSVVRNYANRPQSLGEGCFTLTQPAELHVIELHAPYFAEAEGWQYFHIIDDLPYIRVSDIALWADSLTCDRNYVGQARAICYPEEAIYRQVTWRSSNPTVLFVDPQTGQYVGVHDGTAWLTALATDDSGVTASIPVTVGSGQQADPTPLQRCQRPTISFSDGELHFASTTFGAEFHCTITDADAMHNVHTTGSLPLRGSLQITVYASAQGYADSEAAHAELHWLKPSGNTSLPQLEANRRAILCSAGNDGLHLSGLDAAEQVTFFTITGQLLGQATADQSGSLHFPITDSSCHYVLIHIVDDTLRVLLR